MEEKAKYPERSKEDTNEDLRNKAEKLMTAHGVPEVQFSRGLQDFYNMLKDEGYSKSQRKIYIDNKIATIKRTGMSFSPRPRETWGQKEARMRAEAKRTGQRYPKARKSRSVSPIGYGSGPPRQAAPPPAGLLDLTESQSSGTARTRNEANEKIAIAKSRQTLPEFLGHADLPEKGGMSGVLKEYDAGDQRVPKKGGTAARTAQYLAGEARGHPAGLPTGKRKREEVTDLAKRAYGIGRTVVDNALSLITPATVTKPVVSGSGQRPKKQKRGPLLGPVGDKSKKGLRPLGVRNVISIKTAQLQQHPPPQIPQQAAPQAAPAPVAAAVIAVPAQNAALHAPAVIVQGLAERDEYTQQIINGIKGMRAVLPSSDHKIPNISAQPNGLMSMQFGSSFKKDRRILVPGGRIEADGHKVRIAVSKKTPETVRRVTAFLQTEFPYGGKIGGILFTLVGLIPQVIKALPGSVIVTS